MRIRAVISVLENFAPPALQESWDNTGLQIGNPMDECSGALLCLDVTEAVIAEAVDRGCNLVVSHHPLIFNPLKSVTDDTSIGRAVQLLCANGISAINAHTNLDCAPGGVNDCLAQALGLENIRVIDPAGVDEQGRDWGLLRQGTVESQPLAQFLPHVKAALGCEGLRYADGGKPVHRVAVGGGACASELADAVNAGCDTFVTADVKYNQFWDARDLGLTLIDAGHFPTENPVVSLLAGKISEGFPEVTVKISETHRDCMKFF